MTIRTSSTRFALVSGGYTSTEWIGLTNRSVYNHVFLSFAEYFAEGPYGNCRDMTRKNDKNNLFLWLAGEKEAPRTITTQTTQEGTVPMPPPIHSPFVARLAPPHSCRQGRMPQVPEPLGRARTMKCRILLTWLAAVALAPLAHAVNVAEPANATVLSYSTSHGSYPGANAFDGDLSDTGRWLANRDLETPVLVTWQFTIEPHTIDSYRIMTQHDSMPNRAPDDFTLEGSNDNSNWTVVDTVLNESTGGSTCNANEWRMYGIAFAVQVWNEQDKEMLL